MRQAHALEPTGGTIAIFFRFSCEECSHLRPAQSGQISVARGENVSTLRTRDKKWPRGTGEVVPNDVPAMLWGTGPASNAVPVHHVI